MSVRKPDRVGVLFVCTANICRSPMVEGAFRAAASRLGVIDRFEIASAGTHDSHAGERPDHRAIASARSRGIDIAGIRARQVGRADFGRFQWILAMEPANLRALSALRPAEFSGHLGLLLDLLPQAESREVPDPYYGAADGFERVLDLAQAASDALLARLLE